MKHKTLHDALAQSLHAEEEKVAMIGGKRAAPAGAVSELPLSDHDLALVAEIRRRCEKAGVKLRKREVLHAALVCLADIKPRDIARLAGAVTRK